MTIHADHSAPETAVEDQAADVRTKFGISVEDYMLPRPAPDPNGEPGRHPPLP